MSKSKVNPKLVVSDYFDSLINRVDVHTEELLEEYPSQATIEDPNNTLNEKNTVVAWEYFNETRETLINKISETQVEALKKLETIRIEIKKDETAEEIYEKVFANRFLFLIQINFIRESTFSSTNVVNDSPFKLLLVETYFYINQPDMLILRYI